MKLLQAMDGRIVTGMATLAEQVSTNKVATDKQFSNIADRFGKVDEVLYEADVKYSSLTAQVAALTVRVETNEKNAESEGGSSKRSRTHSPSSTPSHGGSSFYGSGASASSAWGHTMSGLSPNESLDAGQSKPWIARLSGFPFKYGQADLVSWGREIMTSVRPTVSGPEESYEVKAGGAARTAVVIFQSTAQCESAIEAAGALELVWEEPEDKTRHMLKLAHDSPPAVRRMGDLLSVAWSTSLSILQKAASDADTITTFLSVLIARVGNS